MTRRILAIAALLLSPSLAVAQEPVQSMAVTWSNRDIAALKRWIDSAEDDALPAISTRELDEAISSGDPEKVNGVARDLALRLARMHLLGAAGANERAGWHIVDSDTKIAVEPMLAKALENNTVDTFFALLRPTHPEYSALRSAFQEPGEDVSRREAIARNMERWRWMPRSLGKDYVLVNAAAFEATLWRAGSAAAKWRVIVGKRTTPTPVFSTEIRGVIFNPWWEIPSSIVRESVGSLVRRSPSLARSRGYVWGGGRYRQRPGPNNALGQMKLVMPNPYSVYMHDTPNKNLFEEETRAFSHGCIRTGDAIGYAATLLEGVKTRDEIDQIVASLKTTRVDLAKPIPVYITYFTAVSDGAGGVEVLNDVYNRDRRIEIAKVESECSATAA